MNDFLDVLVRSDLGATTTPSTILFVLLLSFGVGLLIGFVYMWTHEALSYSRTYVAAIAVLPMLVAAVMLAMSGSLVVAFGLLGVFGVVRFRNVLKDTRDTAFILWTIMEGMAIGTQRFSTAFMAAVGLAAAFLCLRFVSFGLRQRYDAVLTVRATGDIVARMAALKQVLKRHACNLSLASDRRTTKEGTDLSYHLLLRDPSRSGELQTELASTEGIENISVYMHEDEAEI
jgi:hypothetical protein